MSSYLDNEFLTYAPVTMESIGIIRVKITSDRGQTKWLNVDPTAAREIETAIENSYTRRAEQRKREAPAMTVIEDSDTGPARYPF